MPPDTSFTFFHIQPKPSTNKGFHHPLLTTYHSPLNPGTTFEIIPAYFFTKKLKEKQVMKTITTLALIALTILSASAQFEQSILNLRLNDNAAFKVVIDGQPTGGVGNVARLTNLQGGKHFLQVYRIGKSHGKGHGHGYGNSYTAFSGVIILTANAESWVTVHPELQKVKFDDIRAFMDPCNPNKIDCRYPKLPIRDRCEDELQNRFPIAPVGPVSMNGSEFNQLKQTINNAGFESTRMNIFKQALGYNFFTTSQVRELMDLFWFEGTKLDVAKLAYPKTIDQQNYYLVNNEFSFSSRVDELGNYIAMR